MSDKFCKKRFNKKTGKWNSGSVARNEYLKEYGGLEQLLKKTAQETSRRTAIRVADEVVKEVIDSLIIGKIAEEVKKEDLFIIPQQQ